MSDRQQLQALGATMPKDETGFKSAPSHYAGERETIDKQRDRARWIGEQIIRAVLRGDNQEQVGDLIFAAHCDITAHKYRDRIGKKQGTDDTAKCDWYIAMARHILFPEENKDPRTDRPDFVPYEEPKP